METGRTLRPRGTRVIYEDGADAASDAGSSSGGNHSGGEDDGGPSHRRAPAQSRYFDDEEEDDESGDEWRPGKGNKKRKRGRYGRRGVSAIEGDSESDDGSVSGEDGSEDDEIAQSGIRARQNTGKRKRRRNGALVPGGEALSAGAEAAQRHRTQRREASSRPVNGHRAGSKQRSGATPIESSIAAKLANQTPEDDGVDAEAEASRLWKDVRARKAGGSASQSAAQTIHDIVNKAPGGLDNWLGVEAPAWPTTCADAMINDRDSLFVGFVYSLQSSSQSEIARCLSHLTKVVQPQAVPQGRLPPGMQHLAPTRRGATHDMYAWRTLALKRGRTGLGGPEDFGLEEGQEDDGEKFGAKEIVKIVRMYGATDVLVVVSRWYGGTMLGPVRFRHIEESAKAALGQHMVNEAMSDLLTELRQLDKDIAELRAQRAGSSQPSSSTSATYTDLDPDKAQRLITARRKQLEVLRKASVGSAPLQATVLPPAVPDANEDAGLDSTFDEAEEAAALEAMDAAEAAAESEAIARSQPIAGDAHDEAVSVKAEPQDAVMETAPAPYIKPDPDAPRAPSPEPIIAYDEAPSTPRVKPEPVDRDGFSPPRPPPEPRVKLEQPDDDDVDLAGWDELS